MLGHVTKVQNVNRVVEDPTSFQIWEGEEWGVQCKIFKRLFNIDCYRKLLDDQLIKNFIP